MRKNCQLATVQRTNMMTIQKSSAPLLLPDGVEQSCNRPITVPVKSQWVQPHGAVFWIPQVVDRLDDILRMSCSVGFSKLKSGLARPVHFGGIQMKNLLTTLGLVTVLTSGFSGLSMADDGDQGKGPNVKAFLNGYQEVPAISTSGKGTFSAKLKDPNTLEYTLSFSDLEGTNPEAHIQFGQFGVQGGIIANLCGDGVKPACTPGQDIVGTITAADILDLTTQGIEAGNFEKALRAIHSGNAYVNVDSDLWKNGEIRGQIFPHRLGVEAGDVHSRQDVRTKPSH